MAEKRVLLIEDDPEVGEVLALALRSGGYAVDLAGTLAEGCTHLEELEYAAVIADLRLPDGNGLEIADRAADLGARTFILSGYLSELPSSAAARHALLTKPMRPSAVVDVVQHSVGTEGEG